VKFENWYKEHLA
jgi:hypothetical protein